MKESAIVGGSPAIKRHLEFFEPNKDVDYAATARRVVGKLLSDSGYLDVSTNVEGVAILVDGKNVGTTQLKKPNRLKAGFYPIRLEAKGYTPQEGEAEIEIEETFVFKSPLKPLAYS